MLQSSCGVRRHLSAVESARSRATSFSSAARGGAWPGVVQVVIRLRLCFSSMFRSGMRIMVQRTQGHTGGPRVSTVLRWGLFYIRELRTGLRGRRTHN